MSFPKELYEQAFKCMRCGFCVVKCPAWETTGWESGSPRGRMLQVKGVVDGFLKPTDYLIENIYKCTFCEYCLWRCPAGVETTEVIKGFREFLVKLGKYPTVLDNVAEALAEEHNIYNFPNDSRADWIDYADLEEVKVGEPAEVVYFVGCVSSMTGRAMGIASSTARILSHLGFDWTILGEDEWCCGNPMVLSGRVEGFEEAARHNVEAIRKLGAKLVVMSCPGCYKTFTREYPKIVGDLGFEVKHMLQVLRDALRDGKLKLSKPVEATAVYHDPCELGRVEEMYDAAREVLSAIPGLKVVEFRRSRFTSRCCGAGGMVKATYPDMALGLAKMRVEEALELGADMVVSSCPTCKLNMMDAIADSGKKVRMVDVTEIIGDILEA